MIEQDTPPSWGRLNAHDPDSVRWVLLRAEDLLLTRIVYGLATDAEARLYRAIREWGSSRLAEAPYNAPLLCPYCALRGVTIHDDPDRLRPSWHCLRCGASGQPPLRAEQGVQKGEGV